jgi:hypothetical protein
MDCIVCKKPLENVFPDKKDLNQPDEGCAFFSAGHYGSRVFDPIDGSGIEINVCDPCLDEAWAAGRVLHHRRPNPVNKDPLMEALVLLKQLGFVKLEWNADEHEIVVFNRASEELRIADFDLESDAYKAVDVITTHSEGHDNWEFVFDKMKPLGEIHGKYTYEDQSDR